MNGDGGSDGGNDDDSGSDDDSGCDNGAEGEEEVNQGSGGERGAELGRTSDGGDMAVCWSLWVGTVTQQSGMAATASLTRRTAGLGTSSGRRKTKEGKGGWGVFMAATAWQLAG